MNRIIKPKYLMLSFLILVFLGIIVSLWPGICSYYSKGNLYVHQAKAFLEGRFNIPEYYTDVSVYNGRFYVPFPPFPAVVLLPVVALFGVTSANTVLVSIALSILNVFILRRILKKLDIHANYISWIVAAFFLGTGYWSAVCASSGVWFFAHIVSVSCILLAINEVLGKGRGVLVGLYLGLAVLSRQLLVYSIFFLVVALWENTCCKRRIEKFGNVVGLLISFGLCVCIYLLFNWIRFGNFFDTGYSYIATETFHKGCEERFGLFHLVYVPFNFIYMFLQGFHIEFDAPAYLRGFRMDPFGTSITFASPFVFAAFWAKWKRNLLYAAWISIALSLIHMLFYYSNGWRQVNCYRYTLDFLPILILLVALSAKQVKESLWKAAIVYSVVLNGLALFCVPVLRKIAIAIWP